MKSFLPLAVGAPVLGALTAFALFALPPSTRDAHATPPAAPVATAAPSGAAPAIDPTRVQVPGGSFLMGSASGAADEKPAHRVQGAPFAMDRYEVTNARFASCVTAGACKPPISKASGRRTEYLGDARFADYPAIFVEWSQADAFCKWSDGRLPTEAEWEHAARGGGGEARTYPWGEQAPDCTLANFGGPGSCVGDTDRVGMRPLGASPYGAMDMAGNVWEWTADWYDADYYAKSPPSDPRGPKDGKLKVMRGGCWVSGADSLRVSCRKAELPGTWAPNVGFRCVYPGGK